MTATPPAPLVVVFDPITTIRWDYDYERRHLAANGVDLALLDAASDTAALLGRADIVVVSSRLPDEMLRLATRACAVLCYSVGMDGVSSALAAELGITVANVPGYCTEEVADHAVTLLLAAQRMLVPCAVEAARGNWEVRDRDEFYRIRRLSEMTVGVIGLGRIGSTFAAKARGLGMTTIGHDPYVMPSDHPDVELMPLPSVLARADAVVLCAALSAGSHNLIGREQLALMRADALLVNVARGGLVDETALADALAAGRLRGAALDVRSPEPPDPAGDPLRRFDNVIVTQHTAATSVEAFRDMHMIATEQILSLLRSADRLTATVSTGSGS